MDHDRLRSWLALPPGAWPPDHYALIGLPRGTGDLADIEDRVLARMELLRPHQLLHPDAVTEGMNRLAQALVCLTDSVARAAYDRGLGIAPAPFEVVEDDELLPLAEVMFEPLNSSGQSAGRASTATSDESGRFRLRLDDARSGAKIGRHRVTIRVQRIIAARDASGKSGDGPDGLSRAIKATHLAREVQSGDNQFHFRLTF